MAKYKRKAPFKDNRAKHNRAYYRQCYRKKGYTTTRDANRMIHHQAKKFGVKCRYYKCPLCHRYHLTKDEFHELTP